MSTAADAHSSSWGNWGMRDAGWEPRKAYNNDPSYSYNNLAETPWAESYQALAAVRDGLLTIEDGVRIQEGDGPDNTERLQVFAKFIQAMSLANLAVVFDQAFIVDETVDDIAGLEMQSVHRGLGRGRTEVQRSHSDGGRRGLHDSVAVGRLQRRLVGHVHGRGGAGLQGSLRHAGAAHTPRSATRSTGPTSWRTPPPAFQGTFPGTTRKAETGPG